MTMKSRESKMLGQVRRWRKKAYQADKTKPLSERVKEDEKLACQFDLPIIGAPKAGTAR